MYTHWKSFRRILLSGALVFWGASVTQSQEILEKISVDNVHFQQTVDDAEIYFDQVGRGKGTGHKLYERWKSRAAARVMPDGRVLSSKVLAEVLANGNRNTSQSRSSVWNALGPLAWTNGGGYNPGVGRVTAIAVEPVSQQIIYIGSPGGGLWKTVNGGSSWQPLGDNFDNMEVWGIAIDPSNTNTIYYGNSTGELYKSTNAGSSFTKILDAGSGKIQTILIHPSNSNIMHVAVKTSSSSARGIYKTTDGGTNWTRVLTVTIEDIVYKPGSTSVLYAAGDNFYKSSDSGDSYSQVTTGFQSTQRMKIAVTPANSDYVYVVQKNGGQFGWFYQSTNSGASFTALQEHTTSTNYIGNQASRDMAIAVSTTNANEVHIGGFDMYVTTNGGTSFVQEADWYYPSTTPGGSSSGHAYIHADIEVLQYIDGNMFAGTDGGIFKSTDAGDNFTDLSTGLGITQFYRINSSLTDQYRVVGGSQDNGTNVKSTAAHSWKHMMGADGMDCGIDPTNSNIIYGMIQRGSLYKSTNGGDSRFSPVQPPEAGSGNWVTPFAIDPNNGNRLYAGYNDLYRHDNAAASGSWVNTTSSMSFGGKLSHIELCPSNSDRIYVARSNRIWTSSDITTGAPAWTEISTGISGTINDIAADPDDDTRVVVCTSFGNVYESTNSGSSWTDITSGLPGVSVISVVLDDAASEGIYAAIDGAVYYMDNSTAWTLYSSDLPKVDIDEIEIFFGSGSNSKVRLATYGRGLWEAPLMGGGTGGTCASTVSSFPYSEGFETTGHGWEQVTTDDFDWTRQTGSTVSTNTGPSGAAVGSYYMYTESSSPNYPSKNALLVSPCFDFSGISSPQLSFQYHMYGANMGTASLDVSTDNGSTWTSVWTLSGDQGNSWETANVDLSAYGSQTVQLRFSGTTSTDWTSDISIDDVRIEGGPSCVTTVTSFPYAESFESGLGDWTHSDSDDFDWIRKSGTTTSSGTGPSGADDGTYYMYVEASSPNYPTKNTKLISPCFDLSGIYNPEFSFRYHMLGSAVGTLKLQVSSDGGGSWTDLWSATGDQGSNWNSASADLSAYAGSTIQLRFDGTTGSSYQGDMCIDKMALEAGINCSSAEAMPYAESFETGLGIWSQAGGDDMDWTRKTGTTSSVNTGPSGADDGSYYMYLEASSPNYPSKNAYLESGCVSLSSSPEASFRYHMYGAAMGTLRFQASDDGAAWTTLWTLSGDQGNSWQTASIDLSAYANRTVKFRYFGTTGTSYTSDICIDLLNVEENAPLAEFNEPVIEEDAPVISDVAEESEAVAEERPVVEEQQILVFPNPARDWLNIQFVGVGEEAQIVLFNMNGQLQQQNLHQTQQGINLLKMHVPDLPVGIYFLNIRMGETNEFRKIEIIH